nr:NAD-dependent epimerase/dehydratase family protein [Marinicella sp. W31]MDC2876122.1 NAD-dependent epimerase/dehydratase family protein [Marinicella sp. W31]
MSKVLVTGGTGFLGAHILVQLLNAGHDARATIRSMDKKDRLLKMLQAGGARSEALELFEADLEDDNGWAEAMADCDYVLHVASPFLPEAPMTKARSSARRETAPYGCCRQRVRPASNAL